jgi:hypothetical protein
MKKASPAEIRISAGLGSSFPLSASRSRYRGEPGGEMKSGQRPYASDWQLALSKAQSAPRRPGVGVPSCRVPAAWQACLQVASRQGQRRPGERNDAYRTGRYTAEAKADRREQRALIPDLRRIIGDIRVVVETKFLTVLYWHDQRNRRQPQRRRVASWSRDGPGFGAGPECSNLVPSPMSWYSDATLAGVGGRCGATPSVKPK